MTTYETPAWGESRVDVVRILVLVEAAVASVMAIEVDDQPVLLGAMFTMPEMGRAGPAVGGPLTVWHAYDLSASGYQGSSAACSLPSVPGPSGQSPSPRPMR